jgi:hypothetical protein
MRLPLCLLLVVCALAVGAVPSRADEGFCPMGTADNWLPLSTETEVPQLVQASSFLPADSSRFASKICTFAAEQAQLWCSAARWAQHRVALLPSEAPL